VEYYKLTSNAAMEAMAIHCKSLGWAVNVARLRKLFQLTSHRFAFGNYPYSSSSFGEQEVDEIRYPVTEHLAPRQDRHAVRSHATDENTEAAKEAKRKLRNEERRRLAKRMMVMGPFYGERDISRPPQNDNVSVRVVFNAATNLRSNIKLKFKLNYIDESQLNQLYEEVEIVLDDTNLRSRRCDPKAWEYGYDPNDSKYREPNWHTELLSDAEWDHRVSFLTGTAIATVREVRESNTFRTRELLALPYNGARVPAGIFTTRDKSTEHVAIQRLQELLKIPGMIHIFYAKPSISETIAACRDAIAYQSHVHPSRGFLDISSTIPN
jgi:hypothetical protein